MVDMKTRIQWHRHNSLKNRKSRQAFYREKMTIARNEGEEIPPLSLPPSWMDFLYLDIDSLNEEPKMKNILFVIVLVICCAVAVQAQPQYWTARGMGGGGALYAPAIGPGGVMFVSSDMTGVYKSSDFGAAWTTIPYQQLQGGGTVTGVRFTSAASTLYAISTANNLRRPMKSLDGGSTWTVLASDPTNGDAYSLYASPASTAVLVLSSYTTVYFSGNGGQSFSQVTSTSASTGVHIAGVAFDGTTITIATSVGVMVSTNSGASFVSTPTTGIPSDEGMVSFAAARQGSTVRAYCVTATKSLITAGITGGEHSAYKKVYTLNAGTWGAATTGISAGAHPFFISTTSVNPDIAYCAGGSVAGVPIVYKTTNGGASWQSVFLTSSNQNIATGWSGTQGDRDWTYGEYVLGFAVASDDPGKVAITDLGFVHVTSSGGGMWKQAYLNSAHQNPAGLATPKGRSYGTNGMENTACWQLLFLESSRMIGCYTDIRGAFSDDGGWTWSQNYTGHTQNTMYRAIKDPFSDMLYAATSTVHDIYQSTTLTDSRIDGGQGKILRSQDQGMTWELVHDFGHPVIWVAADLRTPGLLYAAVVHSTLGGIYRTMNAQLGSASTWTKMTNPPRTEGHPYSILPLKNGDLICTYSARRNNNQFTASSGVFYSTDLGATWADRSDPNMQYWTKEIVVDPADGLQNTWYAGVWSGWGGAANDKGGLYRTTNRGATWTRLLTNSGVTSITFAPTGSAAWLCTESQGLLYTSDIRATTPTFTAVGSFPFKQAERAEFNPQNPGELWVCTFGHGIVLGTNTPLPVELLSFTARRSGKSILLQWSTSTESQNAGFRIQRSRNQQEWTDLGFVPGAGTSTTNYDYHFTDHLADQTSEYWYRLAQQDLDGSTTLSTSVFVAAALPSTLDAQVFPNPSRDNASMTLTLPEAQGVRIRVIDQLGRLCWDNGGPEFSSGQHILTLPIRGLPPGVYQCRLDVGTESRYLRIAISK